MHLLHLLHLQHLLQLLSPSKYRFRCLTSYSSCKFNYTKHKGTKFIIKENLQSKLTKSEKWIKEEATKVDMYSSGLSNVVREWIQTFHVIGSVLIHAILEYSNKGSLGTGTAHTRLHHNHPVTPQVPFHQPSPSPSPSSNQEHYRGTKSLRTVVRLRVLHIQADSQILQMLPHSKEPGINKIS